MYAWAVLLTSKSYNRIFSVIAETQEEAFAKSYSELADRLEEKENKNKGQVKDYSVSLWTFVELPTVSTGTSPATTSESALSFEEQLKQGLSRK